MDDVRVAEMILQQSIENVRILGATQDADRIETALRTARQERDLRQEWLDATLRTVQRLKDDLIHKDAVIKALQMEYVNDMKPLVALREAAEAESRELLRLADLYMAEDGTPGPLSTEWAWGDISRAYRKVGQSLRRVLDACRE